MNAAAYARELLFVIPFHEVARTPAVDPSASYVYSSNHPDFPEQGQPLRIAREMPSRSPNSANNLHSDYSTRFDRAPPDAAEPLRSAPSSRLVGILPSACHNSQDEYSGESDISSSHATEPPRSLSCWNTRPKLIIGIDIGTRYTRVSYATTENISSGHINSITSWPNSAGPVDKVPTLVSYYNWRYSWGYNIPKLQIPLPWLWAILLKNEEIGQFMVLRTDDIPEIERVRGPLPWVEDLKASHALSHYLRALWNHTTETIRNHLGTKAVDGIKFHVVLTLPTVWNRTGSQELRRAARLSGIQDRRTAGRTSLGITRRSTVGSIGASGGHVCDLLCGG
ncbi:hypothetical protein BDV12DRAFT_27243 [Aspergillus spectabilis]